jgi:LasA protease
MGVHDPTDYLAQPILTRAEVLVSKRPSGLRSPLWLRGQLRLWGQLLLLILLLAACSRPPDVSPTTPPGPLPPASPTPPVPTQRPAVMPSAVSTRTPPIPEMPIPTPAGPPTDIYTVQPGDTLSDIAFYQCGCDIEELMALNHIENPSLLQAGQSLVIPVKTDRVGPALRLLPDSEVVYSPAYVDFDTVSVVQQHGGYLAHYTERVNGHERSGAEIVDLVARNFSVGPRLLLALLEYQSGWVTGTPTSRLTHDFPLSLGHGGQAGLYFQLGWAANSVNEGYYGYKRNGTLAFRFADRKRALAARGLNAGTIGVQNMLALTTNWGTWLRAVGNEGFLHTYQALFGDPRARAIEPLVPADLTQPELRLPWAGGHTWYLSGGPHGAWFSGSAWAALDFAPPDVRGHCGVSGEWATAAAAGLVVRSGDGQVLVDLDGDGHEQTGWVLFYLHMATEGRVKAGTILARGDPVGHPSCEGGTAVSSHVHIARRYNGEWIAADGPLPMILSGWRPANGLVEYEGQMVKGSDTRQACECWDEKINGIVSDNSD